MQAVQENHSVSLIIILMHRGFTCSIKVYLNASMSRRHVGLCGHTSQVGTMTDTKALGPTLHWERKSVSLKEGRKVPLQKSSRCDLPQTLLAARSPYQQINCTAISARTHPIPPLS